MYLLIVRVGSRVEPRAKMRVGVRLREGSQKNALKILKREPMLLMETFERLPANLLSVRFI